MKKWLVKFLLGETSMREDLRDWVSLTVSNLFKACIDEKTLTTDREKYIDISHWDMKRVRNGIHTSIMAHVDDVIMKKIEDRIRQRLEFINSEELIDKIVERINKKQVH